MKHLPSTPDIIRNSASGMSKDASMPISLLTSADFRSSVLSSPCLALAVNRERAYVWDYTSPNPVPHPRSFDIPQPARSTEPVPLGSLVTNGASTSIGLVVVSAATGKITFWENIDTAESLSLFGNRNAGVEGSLGGLFSGETVIDITSAEHAGLVVTLSSGRIAQLGLRDQTGKPRISAQFLKSNDGTGGGGLFGSIKGALGIGWKGDVVGVQTRSQGSRGQVQVLAVTASAQIQVWDLAWSGHSSYKGSVDFKEVLHAEVLRIAPASQKLAAASVLDFAVIPSKGRGDEVAVLGDDQPVDLVLLAKSEHGDVPLHFLNDITLDGARAFVNRTIALKKDVSTDSTAKPRLLLPGPGHTAFAIFEHAIALASLVVPEPEGPEAQLLMEAHKTRDTFQDVIYLRTDKHIAIQGSSEEDPLDAKHIQASCIVFIKGFGLARLTATDPATESSPQVSVKSHIEQAVFFGTQPDNIVEFHKINRRDYNQDEIEVAAIEISGEILRSETPFISITSPSLETHIALRQKAMRALIAHLTRHFAPLSQVTRWKLLSDAEKLAAGLALWNSYEDALQNASPQPTLLPAVIKVFFVNRNKARGTKAPKESDVDEIRQWFMYEMAHLDQLCMQAMTLVNNGYQNNAPHNLLKLISETDDMIFSVYGTVFTFRADNAELYGLDPSILADGVLEEGWENLPEPWTATHESINLLDRYVDVARNYTVDHFEKPDYNRVMDHEFVSKVIKENIRIVGLLCMCYRERIGWCSEYFQDKYRNYAPGLVDKFKRSRDHHLRGLVKIGQAGSGLVIAEKYKDMDSLVKLVVSESAYLVESLEEPMLQPMERHVIQGKMDGLQANVDRYFRIFGDEFATAFFDSHLTSQRSYGLLKDAALYQEPLTRFLRAEDARGRLGWINEVLLEDNLPQAQRALSALAQEHEPKLWNKKVELSLGKLMALAAQEDSQGLANGAGETVLKGHDDELAIVNLQDDLYRHLHPVFDTAVDHQASVQLVSDAYAVSIRRDLPALHQLLELAFDDLLDHKALPSEQLIDVLTLMDSVPSNDAEADISGREFHIALKVLQAAKHRMEDSQFQTTLALIWKRCYLQDDWEILNKTERKTDKLIGRMVRETTLCQTMALALQDGTCIIFDMHNPTDVFLVLINPSSGITTLNPSACLGAGSNPSDLRHRFPTSDLLDPIIADNSAQDTELRQRIDRLNLTGWYEKCLSEAKSMAEEEAQARRDEDAALENVRHGMSERDGGVQAAANGYDHDEDSFGGEEDVVESREGDDEEDEDEEEDADGDVDMS